MLSHVHFDSRSSILTNHNTLVSVVGSEALGGGEALYYDEV
jgi:hypothetical protein